MAVREIPAIKQPRLTLYTFKGAEYGGCGGWRRLPHDARYSRRLLREPNDVWLTGISPEGANEICGHYGFRPPSAAELYCFAMDPATKGIFEDRGQAPSCVCGSPSAFDEVTSTFIVRTREQLMKRVPLDGGKHILLARWEVEEGGKILGEVWIPHDYMPGRVNLNPVFGVPDGLAASNKGMQFRLRNIAAITDQSEGGPYIYRFNVAYGGFSTFVKTVKGKSMSVQDRNSINVHILANEAYNGNVVRPMRGPPHEFERVV